jgi:hypothetical protein
MTVLRVVVALLGGLMLLGAIAGLSVGAPVPAVAWGGIIGALFLIGTIWERNRYKRLRTVEPGPGWQRGQERFIDPDTGRAVSVWYNAKTGERQYVLDGDAKLR